VSLPFRNGWVSIFRTYTKNYDVLGSLGADSAADDRADSRELENRCV